MLPDLSLKHCDLDAVPIWEFFRICSSQICPQAGSQSYLTFTDYFRTRPLSQVGPLSSFPGNFVSENERDQHVNTVSENGRFLSGQ